MIIMRDKKATEAFFLYGELFDMAVRFNRNYGFKKFKGQPIDPEEFSNLKNYAKDILENKLPRFKEIVPKKIQEYVQPDMSFLENTCREILE